MDNLSIIAIKTRILKARVKKRLFDLWGNALIKLQNEYTRKWEAYFRAQYNKAIEELSRDVALRVLDELTPIQKSLFDDMISVSTRTLAEGHGIGTDQMEKVLTEDPRVSPNFSISNKESIEWADKRAGALVTGVDEVTKKRIGKIVSDALKNGDGFQVVKKKLIDDYAFSKYRATLISSNELGTAYIQGKKQQFEKYEKGYNIDGFKQWNSHEDDVTTPLCLANDADGWIPKAKEFTSGHAEPPRFPGCRCNVSYRLFNPDEDTVPQIATPEEKKRKPDGFISDLQPENYAQFSNKILPQTFFDAIGRKVIYKKGSPAHKLGTVSLREPKFDYESKASEVHEMGHAYLENRVYKKLSTPEGEKAFNYIADSMIETDLEIKDLMKKDPGLARILKGKENWKTQFTNKTLEAWIGKGVRNYKIDEHKYLFQGEERINKKVNPELAYDNLSFSDTLEAVTSGRLGYWHGANYYKRSPSFWKIAHTSNGKSITIREAGMHEYFAHLNEVVFMGNPIIEHYLPKTFKNMKRFYKDIQGENF